MAMANTVSKLLTMLTVLITATVLKEINFRGTEGISIRLTLYHCSTTVVQNGIISGAKGAS